MSISDKFMASMGGWEDLRNADVRFQQEQEEIRSSLIEECGLIDKVFSTPEGKKVLDMLVERTLYRPAWPATAIDDPQKLMVHGIHREGQNSLVMMLLNAIATARDEQQDRPEI